jgi:CheY-like chemotaxis protein
MARSTQPFGRPAKTSCLDLARVLVVHDELASRLTLQTILRAGGYSVEVAASPAEALAMLDEREYDLVLIAPGEGTRDAASKVLSYARVKEYSPATALITGYRQAEAPRRQRQHHIAIQTENIPTLLGEVADLIGMRASRRLGRSLRHAAAV